MRTAVIVFGLIATIMAVPAPLFQRQAAAPLCSGNTNTPQCCDVDVLGVADLDCSTPPSVPANSTDFVDICAAIGKIDRCCLLPILGQGIICSAPV